MASHPSHSSLISSPPNNMSLGTTKFIGAVEDEWELFSDRESDYTIGPPIGFGASSIVYAATYQPQPASPSTPLPPPPMPCALKVLDLDALSPRSLSLLQRETTLMSLSKHPNVLRVRGSWVNGHKLYITLRLMNKGSAADVMRYGWPGGMEEDVVRCILRQTLQGLNYLHINGFIHRDVKAANLLIDDDGTVLLGDLGVAADLAEDPSHRFLASKRPASSVLASLSQSDTHASHSSSSGSSHLSVSKRVVLFDHTIPTVERPRMGKRKSFVGTPCWMSPELIQGRQYDSASDIWSFGITALELTQGRPPRSRESPQRVLLRTIQDDPPTLDREGGTYKYSRAFKEIIDSCLVKDPSKRPTAQELLDTPFFKAAKKKHYLVGAILKGLPPLTQRQERQIVNHAQTLHSFDSWDFATTLHSATTSVYRRRVLEDMDLAERAQESECSEGVFEMEEEVIGELDHGGHSQEVSLTDELVIHDHQEEILKTVPSLLPSSPSDSDESSALVGTSPSQASSAIDDSSLLPPFVAKPRSIDEVLASDAVVSHLVKDTLAQKDLFNPSSLPHMTVSTSLPSSSLSSQNPHGLWRKIKSNIRRPTSRGNLLGEREKDILSDNPDKTEKSGKSSFFTGGGKHIKSITNSQVRGK